MLFSEFLKERRKVVGLSQSDLSSAISYSAQVISKWEKGTSSPSIEISTDLANALKISLDDFFKLDSNARIYERENPLFDVEAFSQQLKTYRTYRGLTQKEVGERTGINYQSIQRFENGKSLPDINEFLSLVSIYELEPSFAYLSKNLVDAVPVVEEGKPKKNVMSFITPIISSVISAAVAVIVTVSIMNSMEPKTIYIPVENSQSINSNNVYSAPTSVEPFVDEYVFEELYTSVTRENRGGHEEFRIQLRCTYDGAFEESGIGTSLVYNQHYFDDVPFLERSYETKTVVDGFYVLDIYLPDYIPSGEYYFATVYGLVRDDSVYEGFLQHYSMETAHKTERTLIINNINGDFTAPTLTKAYMSSCVCSDNMVVDIAYDIEFEETGSGISKIIIGTDTYFDANFNPIFEEFYYPFVAYYEDKRTYSPQTDKITVTGRFDGFDRKDVEDYSREIMYFTILIVDKVGNRTEVNRNISLNPII